MRRLLLASILPSALLFGANANLILYNGHVITVDEKFSITEAVAITGNRITAVGGNRAVLSAERGSATTVIDLKGKTVLPGLIDSHVHPLEAGLSEYRAPLPPLDSIVAVQSYIRERAAKTPEGAWIVVPRTFPTRLKELRMPTRRDLDVAGQHPVLFDASYVLILNSAGLKLCGIDRNTPNPPRGEIVHDKNGEPNGILKSGQSLLKGVQLSEKFTDAERLDALEKMLTRYRQAGLTSIGDGAVTDQIPLYETMKKLHRLPVRVAMTWWHDAYLPVDTLLAEIHDAKFTTNTGDDWLKFAAYKVNVDGGMTIGTAYQRAPYGPFGEQLYGKVNPDDRGLLFESPEKLLTIFRAARDRGWQLAAHCQGGGAIDGFLDALEALNKQKSIAPTRSHMIHGSFQSAQSIDRARRMGVLADVQPAWLYLDAPALEKVFGYDGMRYFFPLRSFLDAGVKVAGGSDHMIGFDRNKAVNPYNPFLGMWTSVTRKTIRGAVLHPEERITREEALKMYTIWGAYRQFSEKSKGSIEAGKLADLVVIDRDYLKCPDDEIAKIQPLITVLDGSIVFRSPAF